MKKLSLAIVVASLALSAPQIVFASYTTGSSVEEVAVEQPAPITEIKEFNGAVGAGQIKGIEVEKVVVAAVTVKATASKIELKSDAPAPTTTVPKGATAVGVTVGGKIVDFGADVKPYVAKDGVPLLPLASMSMALGADINVDKATGAIAIKNGLDEIKIDTKSGKILINGKEVKLKGKLEMFEGRLMVSSEILSEILNVKIDTKNGRLNIG